MSETQFEKAFTRLEQILERMNAQTISLDKALQLYEEADKLIRTCSNKLNEAEKRIEILIKNRSGELIIENETPKTNEF